MLQLELQGRQFLKISCKEVAGFKEKNTLNPLRVCTRFMDRQKEMGRALCNFFRATASCKGVNLRFGGPLLNPDEQTQETSFSRQFFLKLLSAPMTSLDECKSQCHLWGIFMLRDLLHYFAMHSIWELCMVLYLLPDLWNREGFHYHC